jgi:hypothetical protein
MPSEARSEDGLHRGGESEGNSRLGDAVDQTSREKRRAALEAALRAAAREYEDELLAMFDGLPKWHSVEAEGGAVRHRYWNGHEWVEFELDDPPLWAVETMDADSLSHEV